MKRLLLTLLAAGSLLLPLSAVQAQTCDATTPDLSVEGISSYASDITVNEDRTLTVTETIAAVSTGDLIRHGIYRDFPTTYKDRYGNTYRTTFNLTSVMQDGYPADYHTEKKSNGIRVYIGSSDTLLDPGLYTYSITYTTDNQLGFFKDHDELYWNVTGNGWEFPITQASATVHLPASISPDALSLTGYTGLQGSKAQDFSSATTTDGAFFVTNQLLNPNEGLTLVVMWPKGFIAAPTRIEKIQRFLSDNRDIVAELLFLLLMLFYYSIVWLMVGRDPKRGVVIAQYEAPEGLSPAGIRYINEMNSDDKNFTAAILSCAVKGYLTITDEDGDYVLTKVSANTDVLSVEELEAVNILFKDSKVCVVTQSNYRDLLDAKKALNTSLKKSYGDRYFHLHINQVAIATLLSLIGLCEVLYIKDGAAGLAEAPPLFFGMFWVAIIGFALIPLFKNMAGKLSLSALSKKGGVAKAVGILIVFFLFLLIPLFAFGGITHSGVNLSIIAFCGILTVFLVVYTFLIRQRTPLGRRLEDQIEGFKLFLSVTEKERMNFANPPEKTPELFEKFLPYALALGVEQLWSEQFAEVFAAIHTPSGDGYTPAWYVGSSLTSSMGSFTTTFSSSFSSAISSASTPPGSSSGGGGGFSGGGGSSGGGGGGGGGGGW